MTLLAFGFAFNRMHQPQSMAIMRQMRHRFAMYRLVTGYLLIKPGQTALQEARLPPQQ
jgi:hypothetical protein